MKQLVCLKITPKVDQIKFNEQKKTIIREGVENEINEADKNALEAALSLKEKHGGTITVISMGPPSFEPYLKLAVAMGADDAILLTDRSFAAADTFATSRVLAQGIKKTGAFDLVFCGEASSDGSTEQVPSSIAEWLGIPQITYANDVKIEDSKIVARRVITGGYEMIETALPVLISVELGCNSPRFPDFRRKRWVEREFKLTTWNLEDLQLNASEVGAQGSYTIVKETKSLPTPSRRGEFLTGSSQEIAHKLVEIIKETTGIG
ncbi:MAG: electron transfer flavoprotein subunit beta/FixA family protein [Nitrososphaerota archaeon]|nr:electron transfer flavoprotein subunit beta/FixA family protein [Nitrososphaerota archaeon]